MPVDAQYFTLEVNGNRIHQPLFDRAQAPPSQLAGSAPPSAPARPTSTPPIPESKNILGSGAPPAKQTPAPASAATGEKEEWHDLDLQMTSDEVPDINLEPPPAPEE
jgi:hypothetical protein